VERPKLTETKEGEGNGESVKQSNEHAHHFLDIKGIVHKEFVLASHTANSAYYCDVLWQLCANV
jgi:hypothetical protein